MATKYGFSDIREALVEDLKGAYPTKWENFGAARILGEDVFGSPKPHPNAVLNLFLEQDVKFALPFAAYRATTGGIPDLVSDKPGTVLPRLTLASIIHGMGAMKRAIILSVYAIVHVGDLGVCPDRSCVLNIGINSTAARRGALNKIFNVMVKGGEANVLSPPSFGGIVCTSCARELEKAYLDRCKEFVWAVLPSLFGWGSWQEFA